MEEETKMKDDKALEDEEHDKLGEEPPIKTIRKVKKFGSPTGTKNSNS